MPLTTRKGALSSQAFGQFSLQKSTAPTFLSSANAAGNGTASFTINKPAGTISGNLMICLIYDLNGATFTPPSGWSTLVPNFSGAFAEYSFYKIAGGSEPSSYTFTSSAATSSTNTSGFIATYSNVSSGIDVSSSSFTESSGSSIVIPSISASHAGTLLCFAGSDMGTVNAPTGFTARIQINPASNAYMGLFDKTSSSGSTGTVSMSTAGSFIGGAISNIY